MIVAVRCFALVLFAAVSAGAAAQPKPAPTLKSLLLEQLKMSHSQQDWYVPASKAVEGLTFEQALWKPGKEMSQAEGDQGQAVEHPRDAQTLVAAATRAVVRRAARGQRGRPCAARAGRCQFPGR